MNFLLNLMLMLCSTLPLIQRCCCDKLQLRLFDSHTKSSDHVSRQAARSLIECATISKLYNSLAFNYKKDEEICELSRNYPESDNEAVDGWNLFAPIVDGRWHDWTSWSSCSVTCGDDGTKFRTRSCLPPSNGGTPCEGDDSEERSCESAQPCLPPTTSPTPLDGRWHDWTPWSSCSVTCGGDGTKFRMRSCLPPSNGGTPCEGDDSEETSCESAQTCLPPSTCYVEPTPSGFRLTIDPLQVSSQVDNWPAAQAVDGNMNSASLASTDGNTVFPQWTATFDNWEISEIRLYIHQKSHAEGYTVSIGDQDLTGSEVCTGPDIAGCPDHILICKYTTTVFTQAASDLRITMNTQVEVLEIHEVEVWSYTWP